MGGGSGANQFRQELGEEGMKQALQGIAPALPVPWFIDRGMAPLTESDAQWVGGGLGVGREYLSYFLLLCDLHPDAQVLDVGCGVGRMAWPLAHYLSDRGGLSGFDVVKDWVERARATITSVRSNFHFDDLDVYNRIVTYEEKCSRGATKLINKAKWAPLSHRFDIYLRHQQYF